MVDLTSGFLLFFDATRWLGTAQSCSFHFLNSRMFNIGELGDFTAEFSTLDLAVTTLKIDLFL